MVRLCRRVIITLLIVKFHEKHDAFQPQIANYYNGDKIMIKRINVHVLFVATIVSLTVFGTVQNIANLYAGDNAVRSKSVRTVKGRTVTETVTAEDAKGQLMPKASIAVTIDDPSVVAISLKEVTAADQVSDTGELITAKAGDDGKKAFVLRGLRGGSTIIHLDIVPDGGSDADAVKQALSVKVIEIKVDVPTGW